MQENQKPRNFFEWNDRLYSVGIPQIDDQHKELVALLNELFTAMHAGKGREALGNVLQGLVKYAGYHFATEERLMQQHGYPEYALHKEKHNKMTRKVLELKTQFDDGVISAPVQISNFLKNWLARHIMETDRKFGKYLADR